MVCSNAPGKYTLIKNHTKDLGSIDKDRSTGSILSEKKKRVQKKAQQDYTRSLVTPRPVPQEQVTVNGTNERTPKMQSMVKGCKKFQNA
jgi:hypothetical protein